MNRARVSALFAALAEEFARPDGEDATVVEDRPSRPRSRRRPREIVAPPGEGDELAQARARKMLHARGYREVPK